MGRVYTKKNKHYPSVTTILNIINKPGLMYWYGKHGTAKATEIKKRSAVLGKRTHKYVEMDTIGKGKKYKDRLTRKGIFHRASGEALLGMFNQYETFKHIFKYRPIKAEKTVYSDKYKYAGTLDNLGWIWHKKRTWLVLCDWKTSGKVYWDALLQCVAYFKALHEASPGCKIEGICCVAFNKEDPRALPDMRVITNPKLIDYLFKAFLAARTLWLAQQKMAR